MGPRELLQADRERALRAASQALVVSDADGASFTIPERERLTVLGVGELRQRQGEHPTEFVVEAPTGIELELLAVWPESSRDTPHRMRPPARLAVPPVTSPWCEAFYLAHEDPTAVYRHVDALGVGLDVPRVARWPLVVGAVSALLVTPLGDAWGSVIALVIWTLAAGAAWVLRD